MDDAELVSFPLETEGGGAASTDPPSTTEGTTAALTAGGDSISIEESEETPEARALAQGPYNYPTSFTCHQ